MSHNKMESQELQKFHKRISLLRSSEEENILNFYENWAPQYDEDLSVINYRGPRIVAEELKKLASNKDVAILDVAAGTGLIGIELKKEGYTNIDAVDGSNQMLIEAEKTGAYKQCFCAFLGPEKTQLKTNAYDILVTSGSFLPKHLNESCFEELIRILRPGGHMIVIIGEKYFINSPEYTDALEQNMKRLENEGKWSLLTYKKVIPSGYYLEGNAILFVIQKL